LLLPFVSMADTGMSKMKEQWHYLTKNIEAFDNLLYKNDQHHYQHQQRSNLLITQIDQRKELIQLIEKEVKQLDEVIKSKELEINDLICKFEIYSRQYNSILVNSYRNRFSLKPVYFVFSSQGFWGAYKRWQYMHSFNSLLKSRSNQLIATRNALQNTQDAYLGELQEKESLLDEYQCQKSLISSELKESQNLVNQLKQSGVQLETKLNKHKSSQKLLAQYFPTGPSKIAKKDATNASHKKNTLAFQQQKGKLKWPVGKVRIAKKHGAYRHHSLPDVSYFHNGIDIRTKSAAVKCVQAGEVVDVFQTPGHKYTVLVQHGDYFCVYSNLSSVAVALGDQIKQQAVLGTLTKKPGDKTNKLHFELWKGNDGLDPQVWLRR